MPTLSLVGYARPLPVSYLLGGCQAPAHPPKNGSANWLPGLTIPSLAVVKLAANGKLDLYNAVADRTLRSP